jgi:hypothetical protein
MRPLLLLIVIFIVFLSFSCTKENSPALVVNPPTTQGSLLGTWSYGDYWVYDKPWNNPAYSYIIHAYGSLTFTKDSLYVIETDTLLNSIQTSQGTASYYLSKDTLFATYNSNTIDTVYITLTEHNLLYDSRGIGYTGIEDVDINATK